jgi:hypothetical protein
MDKDKTIYEIAYRANEFYGKKLYNSRDIAKNYLSDILQIAAGVSDFPPHFKRNLELDLKELQSEENPSLYKNTWTRTKCDLSEIETYYRLKNKGRL